MPSFWCQQISFQLHISHSPFPNSAFLQYLSIVTHAAHIQTDCGVDKGEGIFMKNYWLCLRKHKHKQKHKDSMTVTSKSFYRMDQCDQLQNGIKGTLQLLGAWKRGQTGFYQNTLILDCEMHCCRDHTCHLKHFSTACYSLATESDS